jgi:replicative DNA helicase
MILSCLLIILKQLKLLYKLFPIDAFYFKNHQEIYKAIIFMYQNKISIDILTLITFLQDNGLLKNWRG